MSRLTHPILIGCSGWSYSDWVGAFYPEGLPAGDYLEFYADRFPVVEVDTTFYRTPTTRMSPCGSTVAEVAQVLMIPAFLGGRRHASNWKCRVGSLNGELMMGLAMTRLGMIEPVRRQPGIRIAGHHGTLTV